MTLWTVTERGFQKEIVQRVIDGDTIVLESGERVRFIGVNTPEANEPFGSEATEFTRNALEGKTIWLQQDTTNRDRYDRLLRYIWLEVPRQSTNEKEIRQLMFNAILVSKGYAQPATYPPNTSHSELFQELGREARIQHLGLWGINVEGTTKGDYLD